MKRTIPFALGLAALACAREAPHRFAPRYPPPIVYRSASPPASPPPPTPWHAIDPRWTQWMPTPAHWGLPIWPPVASNGSNPRVEPQPVPTGPAGGGRYGSLSSGECLAALGARGIAYRNVTSPVPGTDIPVRLAGPLRGVQIVMLGANQIGTSSSADSLDCRLALALDDFAAVLSARGVVRVNHMSLYRPNAVVAGKGTPSQHAYGLAIDVGSVDRADGARFVVQRDWTTERGSSPCPGPPAEGAASSFLRDIVCSSLRAGVFNTYITPNHNSDHDNHFHFDIIVGEPGVFAE